MNKPLRRLFFGSVTFVALVVVLRFVWMQKSISLVSSAVNWEKCDSSNVRGAVYTCTASTKNGKCVQKSIPPTPPGKTLLRYGSCGTSKCSGECYLFLKKISSSSSKQPKYTACPKGSMCSVVAAPEEDPPCGWTGGLPAGCTTKTTNVRCGILSIPECVSTCHKVVCSH